MQIRIRGLYRAAPETVQRSTHAREPSLLAPKVRVQPLLEIYTAEVRFTRKIIFLQKIYSLKSRDLSYRLMGFGVWSARLALRITWLNKRWDELWSQKPVAA